MHFLRTIFSLSTPTYPTYFNCVHFYDNWQKEKRNPMISRIFTTDDQDYFARLSGDYNPVHLDPQYARRTIFGDVVVHGVHIVLWAIEEFLKHSPAKQILTSIKVEFRNALYLNEAVYLEINQGIIIVKKHDLTILKISNLGFERSSECHFTLPTEIKHQKCKSVSFASAAQDSGTIQLFLDKDLLAEQYPTMRNSIDLYQTATLLATTRLVGMICPGERSVFKTLELDYSRPKIQNERMQYAVDFSDERFSLLAIKIEYSGLEGKIVSHMRPGPQIQHDLQTIKGLVNNREFIDQNALVIGGSRGLGEVAVKILAIGGASVRFSYLRGEKEATEIAHNLKIDGFQAETFKYDVLDSNEEIFERLRNNWIPTHVYYFATPFIFGNSGQFFSEDYFHKFCLYYCKGFVNLLNELTDKCNRVLAIYYPSTQALDINKYPNTPLNLIEYAAAKSAGETICEYFSNEHPDCYCFAPRLPRLNTDQTASFTGFQNKDTFSCILDSLITFRDSIPGE